MNPLLKTANALLEPLDVKIVRASTIKRLWDMSEYDFGAKVRLLLEFPKEVAAQLAEHVDPTRSQSQIGQDLFALAMNGLKRGGFFVEFGAFDGVMGSNTFLLERHFEWRGILSEPARSQLPKLRSNRSAVIEEACVWKATGEMLTFADCGQVSTIEAFRGGSPHQAVARNARTYAVPTISLADMLDKHGAPRCIDFLSVDTEGSELDILSAFDFGRYTFNAVCVEHNFGPQREPIHGLLETNGYRRVFAELSQFDDWYVPR